MSTTTTNFDYIVCGAGSAGAALAARLSESGRHSVLLLEAGPKDRNFWTKMPMGVAKVLSKGIYVRDYFTEPDPNLKDRSIYWPRGWATGGSSTVNGMIWVHGTPYEYDRWAADGCPGWGWDDLRPWFRKIETFGDGTSQQRGSDGPMTVTEFKPVDEMPDAFLDSVVASGIGRRVNDYNERGLGGSYLQYNTRNGIRCNTRMAYLDPAEGRTNLTVITGAMVSRLVIEDRRATGVKATVDGRQVTFTASREICLCSGTFGSAQLLELSGIGRGEVLDGAGVPLVHELPMVGENLSEHVYTPIMYRSVDSVSWNRDLSNPLLQMKNGLRWLLKRDGRLSSNSITAQSFVPAEPGQDHASIKLQVQQISTANNRGKGNLTLDRFSGIALASFQICPESRGSAHIVNSKPDANARMVANHLTDPRDIDTCLLALKMSRKVAAAGPLSKLLLEERTPGPEVASDESLVEYLRQTGATAYHPVGTCRIGEDAAGSVVDPRLKVHGIDGLRVADASVMPSIASTNTNALSVVIGERAAAFMLEDAG